VVTTPSGSRRSRRGRPSGLRPDRADRIIEVVAAGNHLNTACLAAGVPRSTVYGWLHRAEVAALAAGDGLELTEMDAACLEFGNRLAQARAQAEMRAVHTVVRAFSGGILISERPMTTRDGVALRDEAGRIICQRRYTAPDGRLALAYLGRAFPDRWGPSAPAEETHWSGEGPGQAQEAHEIEGLARRVREAIAAITTPAEPVSPGILQ
jgi:hypothetical protein